MIIWTEYFHYRANIRGFDLEILADIVNYSTERYFDTESGRTVVIGRYDKKLVIVPYERDGENIIPVTVHVITRQQINYRLRIGRLNNE